MIKAIKKSAFPHSEPPRHNAPKRPLPERQLLASTLPDLLSLVAPKKLSSAGKIRPPSAAAAPQRAHHALQGEPAPLPGQWAARGGRWAQKQPPSSPPAAPSSPPVQWCQAMWGLQPCPTASLRVCRGVALVSLCPRLCCCVCWWAQPPPSPCPSAPLLQLPSCYSHGELGRGKKQKGEGKTKQNKTKNAASAPPPCSSPDAVNFH